MHAPDFWYHDDWRSRALAPLGKLYALGTKRRLCKQGLKLDIPVVCVGNINAGGTGKTPTVMALLQHLLAEGWTPHVLSRGHGGKLTGPARVDINRHTAADVGDEPLLLAAFAPVWISRDRALGAKAAQDAGANILIMDDGHQNPSIQKDLTLITVDAQRGFGNGRCIPAGPLREPVSEGLARASAVLSIGNDSAQQKFDVQWGHQINNMPHLRGALQPLQTGLPWDQMRVFAFAGIGHPEKFFSTLRSLGATVVHGEALGDHQTIAPALLERLLREAQQHGAQLVTTEKDAARLPERYRYDVLILPVRLDVSSTAWAALLNPILKR